MGRTDTPKERIEILLCVKKTQFPGQIIDWVYLLDKFTMSSRISSDGLPFQDRMQFLVMHGMLERVDALAFKVWRDHITNMIQRADYKYNMHNHGILCVIQGKIAYFEDELPKLKETTSILELALWKLRMNENIPQEEATQRQKKIKTDESSIRQQCRVTCGADVVIKLVLPYII